MTAFVDPEVRKLVVKWSRGPSGGTQEDFDMITFHFVKLTGGAPDANWLAADFAAIEARMDTFWGALKLQFPAFVVLAEYRWFVVNSTVEPTGALGPPNPSIRTTARAVAGTDATGHALPPEVAITLTEITSIRKRWGRVYFPWTSLRTAPTNEGRVDPANITVLMTPALVFYNGCKADNRPVVVWSRGNNAYVTAKGTAIPAHAPTAYTVDSLQVDNLYDVQRSRRYDGPTSRTTTALT